MKINTAGDAGGKDKATDAPGPSGKGQLEAVSELKEFGKWNSRIGVKIGGKWFSLVGKAEKIQAILADVDEGDLVEYTTKENRWTGKDGNQNIDFWITSLKRTSPATREGQEDVHAPVPEEKLNAPTAGNVPARERPVQAEVELLAGWDGFRAQYAVDVQDAKAGRAEIIVQVKTLIERVRDLQAVIETSLRPEIGVITKVVEHAADNAALTLALLRKERATEKPAGEVPKTPLPKPAPGLSACKHDNTFPREKVTLFDGITRKWDICNTCNAELNYRIFNREGKDITNQRQLDVKEVM